MRSNLTVLTLIGCFFIISASAQTSSNELTVFGQTGKLYLEHTVVAKENWYSVGRLYNTNAKELAPFNHLALTQPLAIGQVLQIPLTAENFSQDQKKTPAETLIPVYHITQEKEWMYRISVNHNKVPIPTLEKWNNVNKDAVRPGMHLIVGYLKVRTALSALASIKPAAPVAAVTPAATTTPATTQAATTPPATTQAAATPPATTYPATTQTNPSTQTNASTTIKPVAARPADSAIAKPLSTTPSTETARPAVPTTPAAQPTPHFDGGIFKTDFLDNGKTISGNAGIFKSTSGWQDGKYYALMNNIAIGSIIKVTDAAGKTVFVKVLGQLPEMKESVGLTIRISNAAAAEMGITGDRFNVTINY